MRILKALWLLTRTIALSVIVDVSVAAAQTVIVRSAPAGAPIEIQIDGGAAQTATADAKGDATFTVGVPGGSPQAAVQVFVDRCEPVIRVQLVRRGVPISVPAAGCRRGDISGAFLMQSITTFVVDMEQGGAVHVRQGPPPRSWLSGADLAPGEREIFRLPAPAGFAVAAGAGIANDGKVIDTVCGDVTGCSGDRYSVAGAVAASFWFPTIFGVQATLAKRVQAQADGSGASYRFSSTVDTRLTTISVLAGKGIGPTRLYAQGGLNRQRTTVMTTQDTDARTVTVNNVTQTFPAATQTLQYTTEGWGWLLGGGFEAWANRFVGLYVDGQYLKLRGSDVTRGEARTDESLLLMTAGVRLHVGR
jgi:hypothetical protein